jgi:uncharacterized membrane protein
MNSRERTKRTIELEKNYKDFNKILKYLLLVGIIAVSGFLIYYILTPEPGNIDFGILNSDKKAGNFPKIIEVDENVSFYLTVDNYLNREFSFRIEILKSNGSKISHPSDPLTSQSVLNTSIIALENRGGWISNLFNISFNTPGDDQNIIAELWEIKVGLPSTFFASLYLRFNVTL